MIYIYDGSFIGLLSLINYLIKRNIIPLNIKDETYQENLLEKVEYINITNNELIIDRIIASFGEYAFNIIYNVFLSSDESKEINIYYFLINAIKYKKKIVFMRNIESVNNCLKISSYVKRESHRLKGFVRFKELENKVLYAEIEPVNNVISFLSYHFKNRLKYEYWIIKDIKRNIMSVYDKKNFYIISASDFKLSKNKISRLELSYEEMWKTFYKTIGIKERKNDRCRMNFMPKKYWKYILEVSEENEKSSNRK